MLPFINHLQADQSISRTITIILWISTLYQNYRYTSTLWMCNVVLLQTKLLLIYQCLRIFNFAYFHNDDNKLNKCKILKHNIDSKPHDALLRNSDIIFEH
jgi:hypothetical protein